MKLSIEGLRAQGACTDDEEWVEAFLNLFGAESWEGELTPICQAILLTSPARQWWTWLCENVEEFPMFSMKWWDLAGMNLTGARLVRADLMEANLTGTDLSDVRLERADLTYARLVGANLEEATMRGSLLEVADLRGARLEGANLEGAVLRGARLEGANLAYARLARADLRGASRDDSDSPIEGWMVEDGRLWPEKPAAI